MKNVSDTLNSIIDRHVDEQIDFLKQLVAVYSVANDDEPEFTFGKKCAEVLDIFLEKSESMGFATKNYEYYVGTTDFNDMDTKLAVICHLDVVPINETGWIHDPFGCEYDEKTGRIYGRGTIDDKGPATAVLYALKAIKESGLPVRHNVRFITGCNEERGSSDMEYYKEHETMPPLVFTPDGDYPVINIEKGMMRINYLKNIKFEHIKSIKGGNVVNAVPENAEAVLTGLDINEVKKYENSKVCVSECKEGIKVAFKGVSIHASTPEKGDNAITGLFELLSKLDLAKDEKEYIDFLSSTFVYGETDGEHLGIKIYDNISGGLTEVLSMIDYDGQKLDMKMDIRYPICTTKEYVFNTICNKCKKSDTVVKIDLANDPHSVDEESDFVQTLLRVYSEQTGEEAYAKAIGGGTYVHEIEGGVAFGAEFPGEENNMHGNDESIRKESLIMNTKIIANAIYELISKD